MFPFLRLFCSHQCDSPMYLSSEPTSPNEKIGSFVQEDALEFTDIPLLHVLDHPSGLAYSIEDTHGSAPRRCAVLLMTSNSVEIVCEVVFCLFVCFRLFAYFSYCIFISNFSSIRDVMNMFRAKNISDDQLISGTPLFGVSNLFNGNLLPSVLSALY